LEKEEAIEWGQLPYLAQKSGMPDFVKGLRDIKECTRAIFLDFDGFVNPVSDAMSFGWWSFFA
jgi:hypothetical protein